MDSISSRFKKRICCAFTLALLFTIPAFAQDSVISSVVISKSKENPNAYELNIDSTEPVQYKATVEDDGNIYFDLKNSTVSPNIGTVYDDVSNIDNVIVQQIEKNKVRIYVKGKDVKNTELVFVNSLFDTTQEPAAKKIIINRPIGEYQSTSYKEDLEDQEEVQAWDDNSFNIMHLLAEIFTNLKEGVSGFVLIILSLFTILAVLVKTLSKKLTQDREPLIGLNNTKLNNSFPNSGMYSPDELQNISKRSQTIRNAQAELLKAHQKYQTYLQNKYKENYPAKVNSIDVDSIKKSIAINQYQKSTQNPYKNQEVIKIKEDFTQKPKGNYQIPPRPKRIVKPEFSSPYIQRKPNVITQELTTTQKKSNMRFLESVTKIYEQSGRRDLADGLKNSISKAKQSI